MARQSNRERILDAFEELLTVRGAHDTTLDSVAEAAGVSKGGLIYHFASKRELFAGFGERLLRRLEVAVANAPEEPAAIVAWYLSDEVSYPADTRLWRSMIAALHGADMGLGDVIHEAFELYATPLSSLEPELAEQVRLLGDGMFLNALLNIPPPDPDLLVDLVATLTSRIGPK